MELFIMIVLGLTSIVSVTFIVERGLALRRNKVIPAAVQEAVETCRSRAEIAMLTRICEQNPSTLSRILLSTAQHLDWPKVETVDALQTKARHEVTRLERGLVVLEIVTGIAPLLGLVGTVYGMIALFGSLGDVSSGDSNIFSHGIAIALKATLMGLLIAIPSLVSWSYYSKKVENFGVEMETLCDEFLRRLYRADNRS